MKQILSWEADRPSICQEIPAFYGTRRFIATFTTASHLSLSLTRSMQFMHSHYFLNIHF